MKENKEETIVKYYIPKKKNYYTQLSLFISNVSIFLLLDFIILISKLLSIFTNSLF